MIRLSVLRSVPGPLSLLVCLTLGLVACGGESTVSGIGLSPFTGRGLTPEGYASVASCGPDDAPETGIQGRVSIEDRNSGRSLKGYNCNLKLVGQYQGEGTTWVNQSYKNCAYTATALGILPKQRPGVQVIDVSKPSEPRLVSTLATPSFVLSTWESLKVNETRGLLGGVAVGLLLGAGFFDVYDISQDCTKPVVTNGFAGPGGYGLTLPANVLGHEGQWSPDGKTYWATGLITGSITAIDVSNPKLPYPIFFTIGGPSNHGFELSPDGNRLYLATTNPSGVQVLDVSEVQSRKPNPRLRQLGAVTWTDGSTTQHTIPVSYNGKPMLLAVDEMGRGAVRFIDIQDETKPVVVSKLRLAIHDPKNAALVATDTAGEGLFGYEAHYCTFDRKTNPTALACGFFQSGIRVFDVRDPSQPREIAYFNPPGQQAKRDVLRGSEHANGYTGKFASIGLVTSIPREPDMKVDWCSSPPRFVNNQLWVACQDNGFMVLEFQNGVYPIP